MNRKKFIYNYKPTCFIRLYKYGTKSTVIFFKQENLFNNNFSILFDEEEIIRDYRDSFTENFETHFDVVADKVLMGKRLDVYSVLKAKIEDNQKQLKR